MSAVITAPVVDAALLTTLPTGLFINGVWADAAAGATFDVQDPATGEVIATIADADAADGMRALDAAADAAASWAATPARERGELLRRTFDALMDRREQFASLISSEMGKPLAEARGEVNYGGEFLRWFSEEAVRISGRFGATPEGTGRMVVSQRPVGPCLLITPWNFPLAMATRKIAPALAAGCTVVVKPAELTPLTTLAFVALLEEMGLPIGVVNVITTTHSAEVCAPILADERLRKLSFTGSTPVGKALLRQASDNVLRTSMELGGNAPFLVFDDADLDLAVEGAMLAKFRNMGQACTAANRFLVQAGVAGEFTRRISERVAALTVGHGHDAGTTIGPVINDRAVQNIAGLLTEAQQLGATVVTGGNALEGAGSFFEPTVVTGVPDNARLWQEEIFGPVLAITTFETEEDAVRLANSTEFGLVGYVFTTDLDRGYRMIDAVDTGMMGLNTGLVSNAAAPFGGVKSSGVGREGGTEGIHEYLETKYTLVANPAR